MTFRVRFSLVICQEVLTVGPDGGRKKKETQVGSKDRPAAILCHVVMAPEEERKVCVYATVFII